MDYGVSYTTVLGTAGTIGTTLTIITLWIWRRTTKLDGNEEERLKELSEREVREVSEELSRLFVEIEGELGRYRARGEKVQSIIARKLREGRAEELVQSHETIGQSLNLYNGHKAEYENAYGYFGYAAMLIALDVFLLLVAPLDRVPFGEQRFQFWAVIPALGAIPLVVFGIRSLREARRLKKRFNERWRTHRYN